ncbi:hypothetical protein OHB44_28085 [Micromonospora sp. NBC_00821]|uniref:hypothetical protein n=1 Tax=Micromonospora sp. NBC_00821 TaxID=2975977 RepID=UPI002ED55928|nr:hypothetical protein OHB44_28085 [Micromonospora sp. NBC_00821]
MTDVVRPKKVLTEEQLALLAEAVADAKLADAAVEKAWASIKKARDAGVGDMLLMDPSQTGWSRATLNRRYGPRTD